MNNPETSKHGLLPRFYPRCNMRTALFGVLALVGGAPVAQAQQMPAYAYPNYYQAQGYPQGAMPGYPPQAQPRMYYNNGTYGYYQGGAQPTQYYNNYPSNNSYPNYYYGAGSGSAYAYPQAQAPTYVYPQAQAPTYVYTPTSRQYNQMYTMTPPARTSSWPMPAAKTTAAPAAEIDPDAIDGVDGLLTGKKSALSFHRPTKDLFWINASYEAAYFRSMQQPAALVTTGSQNDNAPGALGQSSTAVLYGGNPISFNLFSGVKLEAGLFLDENDRFSLDWTGTLFFPNYSSFSTGSDGNGNPVLARPIFNIASGAQGAFLTSLPGTLNGTINIDSKSQFGSTEFNARIHGYFGESLHIDGLFGFRYMQLNESMTFNEHIDPLVAGFASFDGATINPPSSLHDFDSFETKNKFFGAQFGARASYEYKYFTLEGFVKLALGGTVEQTQIAGSTTLVTPGAPNVTAPGSILAVPSNIGTYSRTVFGIVPEFGLNLGIDLCQNVRLKLGYSFLMWNHVVRPGEQINPNVNPGQVPGSPANVFANVSGPMGPTYRFADELFWAHTFNLGVEFHY
jgi:hypothetical protein